MHKNQIHMGYRYKCERQNNNVFRRKCGRTSFWPCSPSSVGISFQCEDSPVFLASESASLIPLNKEHDNNSNLSFLQHCHGVCAVLCYHLLVSTHQHFFPSHPSPTTHFLNCSSATLNCCTCQRKWRHSSWTSSPSLSFSSLVLLWRASLAFLIGL